MKLGTVIFENNKFDNDFLRLNINKIKNSLLKYDIERNSCVTICLKKGVTLICCMLALYEIGLPFLLIDPNQPFDRIKYMIENIQSKYIITEEVYPELNIIYMKIDDEDKEDCSINYNSDLAYILYTSGSTGMPKAVMIKRIGLNNFIDCIPKHLNMKQEVVSAFTNQMFDIFMLETVMSLYNGYDIVLSSDKDSLNPYKLIDLIIQNNVTVLQVTPSRLSQFLLIDKELQFLNNVNKILIGGEKLSNELLHDIQKTTCQIFNMYGPTETTIWSSFSNLTKKKYVDIGRPINGTTFYIIDNDNKLLPKGAIGEICIGGIGLAQGYFGQSELTKKSFVYNEQLNSIIYKTGDLGFLNDNGDYECLGRIDNQIKLRGHRIELEEIDYHVQTCENVELAVSCFVENGINSKIICFIKSTRELNYENLKLELSEKILDYMIPSTFINVENLIYTTSGKIDRKKMIAEYYQIKPKHNENTYNNINYKIINIIEKTLNVQNVTENNNFIDLGINSINFIELVVCIEDEFNIEIEDTALISSNFDSVLDFCDFVHGLLNGEK